MMYFYSYVHQHVSASSSAIFRVKIQEYNCSDDDTFNYNRILVSSLRRRLDYWPKHFGEHIMNENTSSN